MRGSETRGSPPTGHPAETLTNGSSPPREKKRRFKRLQACRKYSKTFCVGCGLIQILVCADSFKYVAVCLVPVKLAGEL
uniref:Uncharacterized protein n=1 Tax=Salix viminalis TaxID=40686 RepID=A0A6N2MDU5_SALVM